MRKTRVPWIRFPFLRKHMYAMAEVITQWAYFEDEFNQFLDYLRHNPKARALSSIVPDHFRKRIKLFRDSVTVSFSQCPALEARLLRLAKDARRLKRTRDRIAHCRWSNAVDGGSLYIEIHRPPKPPQSIPVTAELLRADAIEISALSRILRAALHGTIGATDKAFPLAPDELSALSDFRQRNLPKLPKPSKSSHTKPLSSARLRLLATLRIEP